jgi:hypothetical protein
MRGSSKQMAQKYEAWMFEAALKWIRAGWSLYSFSGQHNVSSRAWAVILKETPELQIVRDEYNKIRKLKSEEFFSKTKTLVDELQ